MAKFVEVVGFIIDCTGKLFLNPVSVFFNIDLCTDVSIQHWPARELPFEVNVYLQGSESPSVFSYPNSELANKMVNHITQHKVEIPGALMHDLYHTIEVFNDSKSQIDKDRTEEDTTKDQ